MSESMQKYADQAMQMLYAASCLPRNQSGSFMHPDMQFWTRWGKAWR